ncbi:MAG: DUF2309 family protein [Actinobacteria bacterium]|nr:DUF2309 family protein [Actinomycetota bacterium]MCB9411478.1 DUF2309 family protein [Actinomycetota bacterium]
MNPFTLTKSLAAVLGVAGVSSLLAVTATSQPISLAIEAPLPGAAGGFALGLFVDALSGVLLTFLASIVWIVAGYSERNLAGQLRYRRFGWLMALAIVGLALLVTGASLPVLALGWTVSGLAVAGLTGHASTNSARAASRYVRRWLNASDVALWAGVLLALAVLPTVNRGEEFLSSPASTAVAATLLIAAIIRSALFPVSRWLPETAEAPSPLSAFLHAGIVNGAGLLILLMWPLFRSAPVVLAALIVIGAASVVVGTWRGRVRADVKGKLASSTTAQMGYMAIQLGIGLPAAALLHLMGHGYYKAWLFLRAGGVISRVRWQGLQGPRGPIGLPAAAAVVGAVGLAVLLSAAAVLGSMAELGWAAALPALLALTAVVVATRAPRRVGERALTGIAAALVATAYLWFLYGWESALESVFALQPVWSTVPAIGWLILLVGAGILAAVGAARLDQRQWPAVWARLARTTLPPGIASQLRRTRRNTVAPGVSGSEALRYGSAEARAWVEVSGSMMGPVWPLRDLVAVNHLSGTVGLPFADIDATAREVHGASIYQTPEDFLRLYEAGTIDDASLEAALARVGRAAHESLLPATAADLVEATRSAARTDTGSSVDDGGTAVAAAVTGLWCRAAWSSTQRGDDPWAVLKHNADAGTADRALDGLAGCKGAARWVRSLPADPFEAIAVELSGVQSDSRALDLGFTAIKALPGWSGHAQWRVRQGQQDALASLFATYLAFALVHETPTATLQPDAQNAVASGFDDAREGAQWPALAEVWQQALEATFRDPLVAEVVNAAGAADSAPDRMVRASLVFCIDVRSERMRRAIERTGPYVTYGYAGFFGAALRYRTADGASFDQCPALISPTRSVSARPGSQGVSERLRSALRDAEQSVASSPVLPLVVAEFGGLFASVASAAANRLPAPWRRLEKSWGSVVDRWGARELDLPDMGATSTPLPSVAPAGDVSGFGVADLTGLARDFLRLTGAKAPFGDLLVIVGHAASVENNAFAASYECGACGGNSGHINARVLAHALNHPAVRDALAAEGWELPESCSAIAAIHDTTTDQIEFDPYSEVNPGALAALSADLERARREVSAERVAVLPPTPGVGAGRTDAVAAAQRRSNDWAQPVPEWGLAGNAAFVVGPRNLTAHLDLGGRVFLHSYEAASDDSEASALRTILTAPVVVAHWINSQYYLSTVAPTVFGAGDKTTHNVVGDVGVTSGAHGDLRVGLPWQSVLPVDPAAGQAALADAQRTGLGGHQPLRLLVLVAAEPADVAKIVAEDATLSGLLASGWITIVAHPAGPSGPVQLSADLRWLPWDRTAGRSESGGCDLPVTV